MIRDAQIKFLSHILRCILIQSIHYLLVWSMDHVQLISTIKWADQFNGNLLWIRAIIVKSHENPILSNSIISNNISLSILSMDQVGNSLILFMKYVLLTIVWNDFGNDYWMCCERKTSMVAFVYGIFIKNSKTITDAINVWCPFFPLCYFIIKNPLVFRPMKRKLFVSLFNYDRKICNRTPCLFSIKW